MEPGSEDASRDPIDALLVAAGHGDLDAFAAFYDRTAPAVFGMLRRVLGHPAQAGRVTEQVYLQAWRTAPEFDPTTGRSAYATVLFTARRALIGPVHDLVITTSTGRAPGHTIDCPATRSTITSRRRRRR